MTAINAPTMDYDSYNDWPNNLEPSDDEYESEEEFDGVFLPYTNQITFYNKESKKSTIPMTLDQWTEEKIATDPDAESDAKEIYMGDYIVSLYASNTLVYSGREFHLNVEPLEMYEPAHLVYNGEIVEWNLDDMETTYRKMNDVIFQTETR